MQKIVRFIKILEYIFHLFYYKRDIIRINTKDNLIAVKKRYVFKSYPFYCILVLNKMDFIKEAISQNGHWETGQMDFPRVTKPLIDREIFQVLETAAKTKFIIMLRGLRRVGKSILARQLLQSYITNGMRPEQVCWFEFDRSMGAGPEDVDSLIRFFKNRNARVIVLDEIMFAKDWQDVLKRHYDLSDIKFIVTGSSALELDKRSSESLVGRFQLIKVKPFSFREYLLLKSVAIPETEQEIIRKEQELVLHCEEYLKTGGFPEAILLGENDRKKYIKEAILDPVFFKDIPALFPNANPDLLLKVLELLSSTAGSLFQFQNLAQALGCSNPTIALQGEILERALLIKQVFNYTKSKMKQKRTGKKIIIADNGILTTLNTNASLGALAENAVGETLEDMNFWRDPEGREIDFMLPAQNTAIEVKYQQTITTQDEKHLIFFQERNPGWKGVLITKKDEKEGKIEYIPLWRWLLENQKT